MDGIWLIKMKTLEAWGTSQISTSSEFSCSICIKLFVVRPEHKKEAFPHIFFYQQGAFKCFTESNFAMHIYIAN